MPTGALTVISERERKLPRPGDLISHLFQQRVSWPRASPREVFVRMGSSFALRFSCSLLAIDARTLNEAAERSMIDRRLRHGGPGRGEMSGGKPYPTSVIEQRNSLIKLDAEDAG
jgi:hypothetical protein